MIVRFSPEAELDYLASKEWYEQQSEGLGDRFRSAVNAAASRISANPYSFQIVEQETRRAMVRPFADMLLYRIIEDEAVVAACFHAKQDPEAWIRRVR